MLYKHQEEIIKKAPKRTCLVWETGTGKTLAAIRLADIYSDSTLVICPKGIKEKWRRDLEEFGSKDYTLLTKEEFRRDWKELPGFPAVIVDECHYFLGMKSQMSQSLRSYFMRHDTPYRYFLSATVYRSTPWDVYVLLKHFGKDPSYMKFKFKFFNDVQMGGRLISVPKRYIEDQLADLVRMIGEVKRLDECADVPEQVFETEYFSLTEEQEKKKEEFYDPNHITRYTMEHRICGGTLGGNVDPEIIHSYKMDRLHDYFNEHKKMIVVCRYTAEVNYLHKLFKEQYNVPVEFIDGSVTGEERQLVLDRLKEQDSYILFVNAMVSEGWELPGCRTMIWYSMDFSLKNYLQMQGRIRRINDLQKNLYVHFVVSDTVDEGVYKNIVEKKMDFHMAIYSKGYE